MHTQELMFFVRFQGCIHIPDGDLLRTSEQDCAAGSPGHRQNPCLLQGAEQVADHHRIAAGAGCQSGAGHPLPVKYRNADQTVQRNGTFGTDAHGVSPLITKIPSYRKFVNRFDVTIDITFSLCYTSVIRCNK